jgi:hypothetical protein
MEYNTYTYLYPPRAEKAIPPDFLHVYEERKWWAQIKKNGTNHLIFISPEKELISRGRHKNELKMWSWQKAPKLAAERFQSISGKGWNVINAELVDHKTKHIKNVNYIHDILVHDGVYLLGTTYAQRYAILQKLFLNNIVDSTESHHVLNEHTWLAKNIRSDFEKVFYSLTSDEDEGLVLKDPTGRLQISKAPWTVKCRKQTKNVDH